MGTIEFILLGLLAGITGGMFGIGGGSVTIPILYFILKGKGLPDEELMQIVIGTSFAAMCLNSLVSFLTHHFIGNVRWKIFLWMLPSLIIGPVLGALVASHIQGDTLRYAFGAFQCIVAIYLLLPMKRVVDELSHHHIPSPIVLNVAGMTIGTLGSILGIGGGIIMVPFLTQVKVPLKKAIGTSSAGTFVTITIAAISFFVFGIQDARVGEKIPGLIGYIYIPAFIALAASSIVGAFLGAYLTRFVPAGPLKKVFALVLAILGIILIVNK